MIVYDKEQKQIVIPNGLGNVNIVINQGGDCPECPECNLEDKWVNPSMNDRDGNGYIVVEEGEGYNGLSRVVIDPQTLYNEGVEEGRNQGGGGSCNLINPIIYSEGGNIVNAENVQIPTFVYEGNQYYNVWPIRLDSDEAFKIQILFKPNNSGDAEPINVFGCEDTDWDNTTFGARIYQGQIEFRMSGDGVATPYTKNTWYNVEMGYNTTKRWIIVNGETLLEKEHTEFNRPNQDFMIGAIKSGGNAFRPFYGKIAAIYVEEGDSSRMWILPKEDGTMAVYVNNRENPYATLSGENNARFENDNISSDGMKSLTWFSNGGCKLGNLSKEITENGTYYYYASDEGLDGYNVALMNINVPQEGCTLVSRTFTSNGTYHPEAEQMRTIWFTNEKPSAYDTGIKLVDDSWVEIYFSGTEGGDMPTLIGCEEGGWNNTAFGTRLENNIIDVKIGRNEVGIPYTAGDGALHKLKFGKTVGVWFDDVKMDNIGGEEWAPTDRTLYIGAMNDPSNNNEKGFWRPWVGFIGDVTIYGSLNGNVAEYHFKAGDYGRWGEFKRVEDNTNLPNLGGDGMAIAQTGSYGEAPDGFSEVTVNVPECNLGTLDWTLTSPSTEVKNASDDGYDGYSQVTIRPENVIAQEKESAINDFKNKMKEITVTENGTYSIDDQIIVKSLRYNGGYHTDTISTYDINRIEVTFKADTSAPINDGGKTFILGGSLWGLSENSENNSCARAIQYANGRIVGYWEGKNTGAVGTMDGEWLTIVLDENGMTVKYPTYEEHCDYIYDNGNVNGGGDIFPFIIGGLGERGSADESGNRTSNLIANSQFRGLIKEIKINTNSKGAITYIPKDLGVWDRKVENTGEFLSALEPTGGEVTMNNGQEYKYPNGFKRVEVNVPDLNGSYDEGYAQGKTDGVNEQKSKLESISITENGVYSKEDGYNHIEVNVPDLNGSYDEGYKKGQIHIAGDARWLEVTENGRYKSKYSDILEPTVTGVYADGTNFYDYAELSNKIFNTKIAGSVDSRLEFWYRGDNRKNTKGNNVIIGSGNDNDNNSFQVRYELMFNDKIRIYIGDKSIYIANWNDRDWHHLIISKAEGLWIDGEKKGDFSPTNAINGEFFINGIGYKKDGKSSANGCFGMIKIDDTIITPKADGFENVNTGELLEVVNDGGYNYAGELYRTIDVNVVPKLSIKEEGLNVWYNDLTRITDENTQINSDWDQALRGETIQNVFPGIAFTISGQAVAKPFFIDKVNGNSTATKIGKLVSSANGTPVSCAVVNIGAFDCKNIQNVDIEAFKYMTDLCFIDGMNGLGESFISPQTINFAYCTNLFTKTNSKKHISNFAESLFNLSAGNKNGINTSTLKFKSAVQERSENADAIALMQSKGWTVEFVSSDL